MDEEKRLETIYKNQVIKKNKIPKKDKAPKPWTKEEMWLEKEFIDWYKQQNKVCSYCGITEDDLKYIFDNNKEVLPSARSVTRGRHFEIDRKLDKKGYYAENCCLACYWCNNAKSDCFTDKQFKPIGKVMGDIIRKIIDVNKKGKNNNCNINKIYL